MSEIDALHRKENLLVEERKMRESALLSAIASASKDGARASGNAMLMSSSSSSCGCSSKDGANEGTSIIDPRKASGVGVEGDEAEHVRRRRYLTVKLASLGYSVDSDDNCGLLDIASDLFANHKEK